MSDETISLIALLLFLAVIGLGAMYFMGRTDKAMKDVMDFLKDSRDRGEF